MEVNTSKLSYYPCFDIFDKYPGPVIASCIVPFLLQFAYQFVFDGLLSVWYYVPVSAIRVNVLVYGRIAIIYSLPDNLYRSSINIGWHYSKQK